VKVTVDGMDSTDQRLHNEWTGDMRSYKRVNDRTLTFTEKKGGKVVTSGRVMVSVDGKSRTVTTTGTNAQGQKT
jgi:hypothetical protein